MKKTKSMVFVHYFLLFLGVFLFVLLLMLGIYQQAEDSARDTLVAQYTHQLDNLMLHLDQTMNRCQNTVYILSGDSSVQQLSRARSAEPSQHVMQMKEAHKLLSQTHLLLSNEVAACFLIYPQNNYIVANRFVSNDYQKEYSNLFEMDGLSAQEWHSAMLHNDFQSVLLPTVNLRSEYFAHAKEILPFVVPLNSQANFRIANMVFCIDAQFFFRMILDDGMLDQGFLLSLTNAEGELLMGDTLPAPDKNGMIRLNETSYRLLSRSSDENVALKLQLAIPEYIFVQEISSITHFIKNFVLIGVFGMLGAAVVYALYHTISIHSILKLSATPMAGTSPYRYIHDIIEELSHTRDTLSQELLLLENAYTTNLLINVCVYGVCSKKELLEASKLLPQEEFCVVVLRIDDEYHATPELLEASRCFAQNTNGIVLHHRVDESVFLVPASESLIHNAMSLTVYGKVGLSHPCSDFHTIHQYYQHAYFALQNCTDQQRLCIDGFQQGTTSVLWTLEQLSTLQNWILSGKTDKVKEFFVSIDEKLDFVVGINSLQHFFVLRQLLRRLTEEIGDVPISMDDLLLPRKDERLRDGLMQLEEYALLLAQNAQKSMRNKDDKVINTILSIIESEFDNPNLSADYLAQQLNCSSKRIYQIVKDHTGKTVGKWIEETRLQFATEMLLHTDKKNEEISQLCGFGTINTFYRAFRKEFGITPGEWREIKGK